MPFAGWEMPLHYGSQVAEHHAVRRHAGVFDVSHMAPLDVEGPEALPFLQRLLANDVGRLGESGKALYSGMLNDRGGVIDDLIVYGFGPQRYRLVVNAATADKDWDWMASRAQGFQVELQRRNDLAILAIQGPEARRLALPLLPVLGAEAAHLRVFHAVDAGDWLVGRTGYTGEDGLEVLLPAAEAPALWRRLLAAGVTPCGLGARDTLRLEAGLALYGHDLDEDHTPLESGLAWTVAWTPEERRFTGRAALEAQQVTGIPWQQVGVMLEGPGVMRDGALLYGEEDRGNPIGVVTSGGFSPTLNRSIALARLDSAVQVPAQVAVRGRCQPVRRVDPPFVRFGQVRVPL